MEFGFEHIGSGAIGALIAGLFILLITQLSKKGIDHIFTKTPERITKLESENLLMKKDIAHIQSDVSVLKEAWEKNNDTLSALNTTIQTFDSNFKSYHKDMSNLMAETKQSMDQSNKITSELLGYMKAKN